MSALRGNLGTRKAIRGEHISPSSRLATSCRRGAGHDVQQLKMDKQ